MGHRRPTGGAFTPERGFCFFLIRKVLVFALEVPAFMWMLVDINPAIPISRPAPQASQTFSVCCQAAAFFVSKSKYLKGVYRLTSSSLLMKSMRGEGWRLWRGGLRRLNDNLNRFFRLEHLPCLDTCNDNLNNREYNQNPG